MASSLMASCPNPLVFLSLLFFILIVPATAQPPCSSYTFPNKITYATCKDLPTLESSLHWNYHPSTSTVDVAFKKSNASDSSWVAWAINPTSKGMVGSQAFVATRKADGSFRAYTSPITSYATLLQEGDLSFPVHSVSGTYADGNMIIFASFQLPSNKTLVNHLWQEGLISSDGTLLAHAMSTSNLQSFGILDFVSGKVSETGSDLNPKRTRLRIVHGILNEVSWGILMPIGAISARYLKTFDGLGATWFHLHRACQSLAFLIGIAGFGTGVFMGNHYGVHHGPHRCIGITLIVLASAQVFVAIALRPKKDDKYRIFWNIFHYIIGYATIALGIWNVFKGFDILQGHKMWKNTYVGIIIALAVVALILEVITWIFWVKKKKAKNSQESADTNQQLP